MEQVDDGDGEHQLGKTMPAQDDRARNQARQGSADGPDGHHGDRIGDAPVDRGDAGRIGAGPEQRRMAERRDAAETGHQVERQHQKRDAEDARQQRQIVREKQIADRRGGEDDRQPGEIARKPASLSGGTAGGRSGFDRRHLLAPFQAGRAGTRRRWQ